MFGRPGRAGRSGFAPIPVRNYLRAQAGHTTSVNLIIATVDYLLRLQLRDGPGSGTVEWSGPTFRTGPGPSLPQESVMDFYWHYSSKDMVDEGGKQYFMLAIQPRFYKNPLGPVTNRDRTRKMYKNH